MDGGKGGQTLRLQGREGENRKQSAKLGRYEKEKKKRDQPGQGDSGKKVTGRERGTRRGRDGQARRRITVALAMSPQFDHEFKFQV